jgi:nicotinamide-nucleotide adenylyltransferase
MMHVLADTLLKTVNPPVQIDIGITDHPMFVDKAINLASSAEYSSVAEQVYPIGYDTLIRLLDTKYYAEKTLAEVGQFFERARVVMTLRGDEVSEHDQREYVEKLRRGDRDNEGADRRWADRIEIVSKMDEDLSSTKAREAVAAANLNDLEAVVAPGLAEYIQEHKLYQEKEQQ